MMGLVRALGPVYRPRHYIVAETDIMSTAKIETMEASKYPRDPQVSENLGFICVLVVVFLPSFFFSFK